MAVDKPEIQSITDGVERRTLPNGLTVLVKEVHAAPVVAAVTWVKTGYFHEPDDLAGISHVVEHMFFNGTPTRPGAEDISRETKAYGGVLNAGTAYDHTAYHVVVPSANWREALAVQADAFQNPLFDADVLEKEMGAILQEARRKLDEPAGFAREKMFETAFDTHRMRRWRIGTEEVLTAMTREDLVTWYEDHYRPQNAIVCIVGDVEAEAAFAEVEKLYGGQEKGRLRQSTGPGEPRQKDFRYRRMVGDLTRGYVVAGFHTPGQGHRDEAALDVLATILGTGRSSRLGARLKEELTAVLSIGASNYSYDDVGVFEIMAVCSPQNLDLTSKEIFVELERLRHFGPTPEEMERARNIILTGKAYGFEEVLGQAMTFAAYEADGAVARYDEYFARLLEVDAEDVLRVLDQYLTLENATLLEYAPYMTPPAREPGKMRQHLESLAVAMAKSMDAPPVLPASEPYLPEGEITSWREEFASFERAPGARHEFGMPGGATLIVVEDHTAPTMSVGAFFRGGKLDEPSKFKGLIQILQRTMVKATDGRDAQQMAREVESLGTTVGRVCGDDWFGFTAGGLAQNFPQVFDILFDVLARPTFPADQIVHEIKLHLVAMQGVEDSSMAKCLDLTRGALWKGHPYGSPNLGIPAGVRAIQAQELEEIRYDLVRPENMTLVISGDLDAELTRKLVARYLDSWNVGGNPLPANAAEFFATDRYPGPLPLEEPTILVANKDRTQTAMVVAFPTVPRTHPDRPAFDVLQSLTGGLGGTFFEEIRTKRGLAYQVSTFSASKMLDGYFGTFVACTPDSAAIVRELVLDLHRGLAETTTDEASLERARNAVIGSYEIGRQSNAARVGILAGLALSGQPLERAEDYADRVRAVTAEDLQRLARTYFFDRPFAIGMVEGRPGASADPE